MSELELLRALLVGGCLGALIGIERQWDVHMQHPGEKFAAAGLRTFVLWSVLGVLAAHISGTYIPSFYPLAFAAMSLMLLAHHCFPQAGVHPPGMTTQTAAMVTFIIGSLVYWGWWQASIVLTITILLLLEGRRSIHSLATQWTREDIRSALQFLAITGIILPIAPNHGYGPYQFCNPFQIWLMVVLVAGLGFFGYVAMRWLGARGGVMATGLLGGLASSTATTLACSRQSREQPAMARNFALAIILACTVMLVRVVVLVTVINPDVVMQLIGPILIISLPGLGYGLWFWMRCRNVTLTAAATSTEVRNPLSLKVAIQFALIYAAVVLFSRAAANAYGSQGLSIVSFLSGLTDMDAIVISVTQMAGGTISTIAAVKAILLAAMGSTLLKACLALAIGPREMRRDIGIVFGATIVLCGVAYGLL